MPYRSPYEIPIPVTDVLSWILPSDQIPSDKPIWIDAEQPSKSLSLRQLQQWVGRLGLGLYRLDVKPGDVVLVVSQNHVYLPIVYFGLPGFGYIFSASNPSYGVNETRFQIENTQTKLIFVEPSLLDTTLKAAKEINFPRDRIFLFDDEECRPKDGIHDWRSMLATPAEAENWSWRRLGDEEARRTTAVLNYSSGTTGLPKGVMISHENIIANVTQSLFMRSREEAHGRNKDSSSTTSLLARDAECWLGFLPLYHAYGQLWSLAAAAFTQTPTYMMRAFALPDFLRNIERHGITHIQTAPPVVVMLAKRPEARNRDLSSLKNILCGAAPLSKEVQNEVMKRAGSGLRVVQTWGMTEVTCSGLHVPGLMHDESGAVGLCDPNSTLKLVDDEGKEVLRDDTRGEIYYKGPNVCLGYWRNQAASTETFDSEGFLKTGDVAIRKTDDKGYAWYWIVDRKKELIKVKGFQVAPAELEAVILTCDGVADAAVVGLRPSKNGGDGEEERPKAYVVLKDEAKDVKTEDGVAQEVAGKVARHKWLTGGVSFVSEVPKSPSGKIQRVTMKKWAERDAEAQESDRPRAKL